VNRAIDAGATVAFSPSNSYVQWADGSRADFHRRGNQFIMPFEEMCHEHSQMVAAIGDAEAEAALEDPDAQAVRDYVMRQGDSDSEQDDPPVGGDDAARVENVDDESLEQQAFGTPRA
jgi:hypothetical protein